MHGDANGFAVEAYGENKGCSSTAVGDPEARGGRPGVL